MRFLVLVYQHYFESENVTQIGEMTRVVGVTRVGLGSLPHEDGLRYPHAEVLHPRDEAEGVDAHAVAHALVRLARHAAAAVHSAGGVDLREITLS